jgi:polysaccharide pyruvyl transferase CsaB
MPGPHDILILGGDADGNLGDRAILISICRNLQSIRPDAAITVVSKHPGRARADYGEMIQVLRPGISQFIKLCKTAAKSDLVLCGGGGLIQDDDSLIKVPYWALRILLMRTLCPRIVGYALGVGPLNAGISRLFARLAFACMAQITVRDPEAQAVAQALTRKPVELVPDPALLLPEADVENESCYLQAAGVPPGHKPVIGVAPRRWFPPRPRLVPQRVTARFRKPSFRQSARLVELLARTLDNLVRKHDAYIVFLPSYTLAHEGDDQLCRMLMDALPPGKSGLLLINSPTEYRAACGGLDVLVGGRMHPTILAAAAGTPVIGLSYNPKFEGFFELLGQRGSVLDVQSFVRDGRTEQLTALIEDALYDAGDLSTRVNDLGARIRQFNLMLMQQAS